MPEPVLCPRMFPTESCAWALPSENHGMRGRGEFRTKYAIFKDAYISSKKGWYCRQRQGLPLKDTSSYRQCHLCAALPILKCHLQRAFTKRAFIRSIILTGSFVCNLILLILVKTDKFHCDSLMYLCDTLWFLRTLMTMEKIDFLFSKVINQKSSSKMAPHQTHWVFSRTMQKFPQFLKTYFFIT